MAAVTAIVGAAAVAATTTMSFVQANRQRNLQDQAAQDAAKAMADARRILSVNYANQLGIPKLPYQLERDQLASVAAQQVEAARESERGVAATAGRVQMAEQIGNRTISADMEKQLLDRQKAIALEDQNIQHQLGQLSLGEVTGAQLKARDAQHNADIATMQGFEGVSSLAGKLADMAPLYPKTNDPVAPRVNTLDPAYSNTAPYAIPPVQQQQQYDPNNPFAVAPPPQYTPVSLAPPSVLSQYPYPLALPQNNQNPFQY